MLARTAKRTAKHILDMALAPFDRSLVIVDRSKPHYHLFDSNMLSAYWNNEEAVATYENSLNRTGMAWSDNLSETVPILLPVPEHRSRVGAKFGKG